MSLIVAKPRVRKLFATAGAIAAVAVMTLSAAITTWLARGQTTEGLANLTGQLIAQGATRRNAYETILERLYPMAASYDIRVDREMTTLRGRTHVDNLDPYYALFTEAWLYAVPSTFGFSAASALLICCGVRAAAALMTNAKKPTSVAMATALMLIC